MFKVEGVDSSRGQMRLKVSLSQFGNFLHSNYSIA